MTFSIVYKSSNKPAIRTYARTSNAHAKTIMTDFVKKHASVYQNVEWYSVIELETGKTIETVTLAKKAQPTKVVDIHAKSNEAINRTLAKHPELRPTPEQVARWEGKQVEPSVKVGDLATYSIGSDSYAYKVTSVQLYKSGAKVGQVRSVGACRAYQLEDTKEWVSEGVERVFYRNQRGSFQLSGGVGRLSIGEAYNYLDPSF